MRNTQSGCEYVAEHIVWAFVGLVWFAKLFFRCLPGCTYMKSWLIFGALFLTIVFLSIRLTARRGRNAGNVMKTLILAYGTYICAAFYELMPRRIGGILLIAGALSVLMSVVILTRKIKPADRRMRVIRRRFFRCVDCFRRNMAAAMLLILFPIGARMLFHGTVLESRVEVSQTYGEECSLGENIETVCKIQSETWGQLSVQEKLDLCQVIANCEGRYLGVPNELNVGAAEMSESTNGYYSENAHQIVLNTQFLQRAPSREVLKTVLHEVYHSYQHAQVRLYQQIDEKSRNLYMFYHVAQYLEEFAAYEDGEEDFWAYYGQWVEQDARGYAEANVDEYFERVNEYLTERSEVM